MMKVPRVPDSITSPVRRLCNRVAQGSQPIYVKVRPEEGSEINDCFVNVKKKVGSSGGKVQYGWTIWYLPGILMEAEFHAVWLSSDGEYTDVSPHPIRLDKILFLPDPVRAYNGKQIDNVRIPLTKDPRVREYIELHEAKFRVMNEGELAKQHGLVSVPQDKIRPILRRLIELSVELGLG